MATRKLKRGANLLILRRLVEADGVTGRPLSTLASLKVELIVRGDVIATYSLGTDQSLRADTLDANGQTILLELTSELTAGLKAQGDLTERYTLKAANSAFVVEPAKQVDIIEITEVSMV